MKTVSNGLIPKCQKDVQHIVSTGTQQLSPPDSVHHLPQSSFTFYLSPKQDAGWINAGHKE